MKQRTPFAGVGVVVRRAADEFVAAIGFSDEAGGPKGGDDLIACAERKERSMKTEGFFIFMRPA